MWSQDVSNNVCRDFTLPLSAFAIISGKILRENLRQKWFSDQAFYFTIIDTEIGRLKSPTLFGKY